MILDFYYRHDRATRWRLLGAVALACVVLIIRFNLATVPFAIEFTQYAGYWLILGTVILYVATLQQEVRAHWPGWRSLLAHWPGLLAGLLIAGFWQVHEPHDFKVLFDEHVLGGIARVMHFEREGAYATFAHFSNGQLVTFGYGVDKRPLMFPFLVSVLHDLTGFRPANSFVLNGLLSFVLLMLVYGLGVGMGNWKIGCFGQLLLAGLPLMAQNATGGGFDLLNITVITAFLLAGWNYWRQPGTGGLNLFVMSGVVLANCRYESMLFLGVVMALALLKWVRERQMSLTLLAALSPVFALPPLLINLIFMGGGGGSYFQTAKGNFLNLIHFNDNLVHAGYFLFMPDWDMDNSVLLSVVGLAGLLLTLLWILRRVVIFVRENNLETPLLLCVVGVLVETFISLLSFWGHWDDPMVERFSLPLYIAFVWCAMFAAARLLRGRKFPTWALAGTAIYAVVAAAPVSSTAYKTHQMPTYLTYSWARDWIMQHADPSVLVVSRASVMFTLYGVPNVHFGIANKDPYKLFNTTRLGLYREVWVVQEYTINAKLNAWVEHPPARLDQRLELQTIAEHIINYNYIVRISKVVGYDPTKPAGIRRLAGEFEESNTEGIRESLGGVYEKPTATEKPMTERPPGEPAAYPTMSQVPTDEQKFDDFLSHQYPMP